MALRNGGRDVSPSFRTYIVLLERRYKVREDAHRCSLPGYAHKRVTRAQHHQRRREKVNDRIVLEGEEPMNVRLAPNTCGCLAVWEPASFRIPGAARDQHRSY